MASESATSCPVAQTLTSRPEASWIVDVFRASAADARASAAVRRTTSPAFVGGSLGVCIVPTAGEPARMARDRAAIVRVRGRYADGYRERGISDMGSVSRVWATGGRSYPRA